MVYNGLQWLTMVTNGFPIALPAFTMVYQWLFNGMQNLYI